MAYSRKFSDNQYIVKWSRGNCTSDHWLNFFMSFYLFVKSFIYPTFTCKPSAFFFADGEISSGERRRSTMVSFSAGAGIEITATFKRLFLKVLRPDVALTKFGQICPLVPTNHFLRSGLFSKDSRWKPIPLLESLGVLFEHPTTAHSTILELMLSPKFLQHDFQNGGLSNCSVTDLFAVTIRLKGNFTS